VKLTLDREFWSRLIIDFAVGDDVKQAGQWAAHGPARDPRRRHDATLPAFDRVVAGASRRRAPSLEGPGEDLV